MSANKEGASAVLLEQLRDGVLTLTLNRPEKFNSFNGALHKALADALRRAAADEACRAIILTGAGKGFCAGQDLGDESVAGGAADLSVAIETQYNPLVRALRALPKPIICAVNGAAAGAGANIALACDIVLAARSAKFLQAFARIGLVPDSGGTWFLPRLVGDARARALALLAEPIGAEEAERIGLIFKAVDDDALQHEAAKLAAKLAQGPTYGYGLIKQALQQSATNTLDAQLDLERDFQRSAGYSEDYAEGIAAFMEKRAPRYTGKGPKK
jgi:2-(1,2-epoxy-1,2-dihydrophenyl)acetyl-CoA isomerase